jgi:hypothetical protein
MNKFIITGHPRTRSAWFAAYLTCGDTYCSHEGIYYNNWPEGYENVGTADSSFPFLKSLVDIELGDYKLIVIERDIETVRASVLRLGLPDQHGWLEFCEGMLKMMKPGIRVKFEEIDQKLEQIHEYLEIPFDQRRADLFKEMHIESRHYRDWQPEKDQYYQEIMNG